MFLASEAQGYFRHGGIWAKIVFVLSGLITAGRKIITVRNKFIRLRLYFKDGLILTP